MSENTDGAEEPTRHPKSGPWWPSRWGSDDVRGALNMIGPEQALAAAAQIRTGNVVEMGFPFESGKPDFHGRDFQLASAGAPSGGPVRESNYIYNDEIIAGNFTGMSTHFNALVHIGRQLGNVGDNNTVHYYKGFTHADIGGAWSFKKLGIETVSPVFTTGLVIDVAGLRGRPLDNGELISMRDLLDALDRQGLAESAILPGSTLFWRTDRGSYFFSDREAYVSGAPGIESATADWLCDKDVAVVGADSVALEPVPPVSTDLSAVHATFLCRRGVYIIVNVNLEPLAECEAWHFAFSCTPIPFVGAQGSPSRPFAIL